MHKLESLCDKQISGARLGEMPYQKHLVSEYYVLYFYAFYTFLVNYALFLMSYAFFSQKTANFCNFNLTRSVK